MDLSVVLLSLLAVINQFNWCESQDTTVLKEPLIKKFEINPWYTHFNHFDDMIYPESRVQKSGFTKNPLLASVESLPVNKKTTVNITAIIEAYIRLFVKSLNYNVPHKKFNSLGELLNSTIKFSEPMQSPLYEVIKSDLDNTFSATSIYKEPVLSQSISREEPAHIYLLRAWRAVMLTALSSSTSWFFALGNAPNDTGILTKYHDEWSVMFLYELCRLVKEFNYAIVLPKDYCPNPCSANPCEIIADTSSPYCTEFGNLLNEFSCICQSGYTWVNGTGGVAGFCSLDTTCEEYCDRFGTMRCDITDSQLFCVCLDSHMGPTCSQPRNPCVEMRSPYEVPGNDACNTGRNGKCVGTIGGRTYHCICPPSYISDSTYPLPNCLALRDRCMSTICVTGDCVSSMDGQETICICPEEMFGEHCELFRGQWSKWAPWSECSPGCGAATYPKRVRTRSCLGKKCRGGAGHLEIDMCAPLPCPDEMLAISRHHQWKEFAGVEMEAMQVETTRYVRFVGAMSKALLLIASVLSMAGATLMAVSVYLL